MSSCSPYKPVKILIPFKVNGNVTSKHKATIVAVIIEGNITKVTKAYAKLATIMSLPKTLTNEPIFPGKTLANKRL